MIARFATHLTVYLCFSYFLPLPHTQKRRTQAKLFVSVFVYSPAGSFSLPFLLSASLLLSLSLFCILCAWLVFYVLTAACFVIYGI